MIEHPTQSRLKEKLDYDPETGVFNWKSAFQVRLKSAGYINDRGYVTIRFDGVLYKAHRLAWIYVYGDDSLPALIDHYDGNPSNNRISNLRAGSKSLNTRNTAARNQLGGAKGVFRTASGKYGVVIHIGSYDTLEEANEVSRKYRTLLFGSSIP